MWPAAYVGPLDESGALQIALEVIGNAVDQVLLGQADGVRIRVQGTRLEVVDDGPGYPMEIPGLTESYLSEVHDRATADGHAPHIHLATSGIGVVVANALSERFCLETVRRGGSYRLDYRHGQLHRRRRRHAVSDERGTRIRLRLDSSLWPGLVFPLGALRRRLFDIVHLLPGLKLELNGERFQAPRGLLDLAEFEGARAPLWGWSGIRLRLSLNLACWGEARRPQIRSWVNGCLTPEHGSHLDGVRRALRRIGWTPAGVLVHALMHEPRYAGPARYRLQVPGLAREIEEMLREPLAGFRPG